MSKASPHLRFNILGPIECWTDGVRLRLGGLVQERTLATLLVGAGKVIPVSRLVEAAWEDNPPQTASHQVRKAVADLRRRIPDGGDLLLTDGPGYCSVVTAQQLDLAEFDELIDKANRVAADGRSGEAVHLLRRAFGLWRGPLLAGNGGSVIDSMSAIIEERRLNACERFFDLRLEQGEAAEVVGELREVIAQHPLRERLRGQLMLALYRGGREAEALEEYGRVRELLAEELGIDPAPQLAQLHEAILRGSPEIAGPQPAPPSRAVPPPPTAEPPCTLPYDLADFTGRAAELAELLNYARTPRGRGPLLIAIDGMGGIGKTALAVHAAHLLVPEYPDGQLYLDLHGYTPGEQALSASAAVDRLLRTLGLTGEQIPEDLAARIALWRAAVTGRRLLVMLDNVAEAADVRPLLPVSDGCLVVVTSRARMVDLDGAHWMSIEVMNVEDSTALVANMLGPERLAADPGTAEELAQLCGCLPLALRLAAARLRNRPRWTVQYMIERLLDETHRLQELSSGARSVSATLRLSYHVLHKRSRTAFRMLALHPRGDISVHAAAALLGVTERDADVVLELLLDVHLLEQPEIGLYAMHDLVRSFAQSLVGESTTPTAEQRAAIERLLGYYVAATDLACGVLFPGRLSRPSGLPESAVELPDLGEEDRARRWFAREEAVLISVVELAARRGLGRHAIFLARNVAFYLNERGILEEFARLGQISVDVSRRMEDPRLLGLSLANLGVACWKLGRFEQGIRVATESCEIAERLGDQHTAAHSETTLGLLHSVLGRFPESLAHLRRAVARNRELNSRLAEADSLTVLSTLHEQWGQLPEARQAALQAVELSVEFGPRGACLAALVDLAFADLRLGAYEAAQESLARARTLCDDSQDPGHVALALILSAGVDDRLGNPGTEELTERALHLVRTINSPLRRAKVENLAGQLKVRQGDRAAALPLHQSAYKLASGIKYRIEEAYALLGMAGALAGADADGYRATGEALFAELGVPEDRRRD